jgi:hypothetical protein
MALTLRRGYCIEIRTADEARGRVWGGEGGEGYFVLATEWRALRPKAKFLA